MRDILQLPALASTCLAPTYCSIYVQSDVVSNTCAFVASAYLCFVHGCCVLVAWLMLIAVLFFAVGRGGGQREPNHEWFNLCVVGFVPTWRPEGRLELWLVRATGWQSEGEDALQTAGGTVVHETVAWRGP